MTDSPQGITAMGVGMMWKNDPKEQFVCFLNGELVYLTEM